MEISSPMVIQMTKDIYSNDEIALLIENFLNESQNNSFFIPVLTD